MKFAPVFAALILSLVAVPHSRSEEGSETLVNPDPVSCQECLEVTVNQPSAKPGSPDPITEIGTDGTANVEVEVNHNGTEGCETEITGTITAKPKSGTGNEKPETFTVTSTDTKDFEFTAEDITNSETWEFYMQCDDEDGGSSSPVLVGEITLRISSCSSCTDGTCDPDSQQGSFLLTIPTAASNGGDTKGTLYFFTPDLTFPGREGLTAIMPSDFDVDRDGNHLITRIDTGAGVIEIDDGPAQNSITILHKDSGDAIYRTTVISLVSVGGSPRLRMDSTFDDSTTRYDQYETASGTTVLEKGRVIGGQFVALTRETLAKDTGTAGIEIKRVTIEQRSTSAAPWQTVSDIKTTWQKQLRGWVKTQEVINPGGEALTSTWTYYQPGEPTGPGASEKGLGRLKHYVRYDGYESFHLYGLHFESVTTPHAGDPAGKTVTTTWDPVARKSTVEATVGGQVISKTITTKSTTPTESSETREVHTSQNQKLTTTTHFNMQNGDFVLKPLRVEHPDGTLTTYSYTRNAGGGFTTVTENGSTSDNLTVIKGMRTITTTNSRGTTIHRKTEAIGHGTGTAAFDEMAVISVDNLGRALKTAYHPASVTLLGEFTAAPVPAWTTSVEYSCCGIAKEKDRYGIETFHAYDLLQRRIKTNRLGVTTETHHLGLTTETHRYPEAVTNSLSPALNGTVATLVSRSVRNLADTLSETWSPDPTSATAGVLVRSSSITTTYKPAAGLSSRTVTTVPGDHTQTTDSFLDGRTAASYGALAPAMAYSYAANATGAVSSQSYVDNGNLRETTTTQSDWAGRTVRTTYMGGAFASFEYNSLGQLFKSTDPDDVVTLHAYNAEGDHVVTATDLNVNGEIDFGTDTVSSSATEPALDDSDNPVWVTVSKVWQDGDADPAAGTAVSTNQRSPDGLVSTTQSIGVSNPATNVTTLAGNGTWTTTSTSPDDSYTVTTHTAGLMDISERFDSNNNRIASTSMRDSSNDPLSGYDPLNRPTHQRDSRTGVTTTTYLSTTADVVKSVMDPANLSTGFTYDNRGRRTHVDAPNTFDPSGDPNNTDFENITITHYFPDGNVQETTGDQTYRTTHTYDYAQRQKTLTTYGTETATTTWIYSPTRGFLNRKEYQGGNGTEYTYTNAGRLETRTWERGVLTTYGYDDGGRLETVDYTNETNGHTTPNLVNTYDALGRLKTVTRGGVLHAEYTHRTNDLQRLLDKQQIDTLNQTVSYTYEDGSNGTLAGRPNGYTFTHGSATWGYDNAGRLKTVTEASDTFTYGYRYTTSGTIHQGVITPGQGIESQMPFTLVGPQVETTLAYENARNTLAFRQNQTNSGTLSMFDYTVNAIGQRDSLTPTGSAFSNNTPFAWGYNQRGELTTAARPGSSAFERAYSYDGIGNRLSATDHTGSATHYFADTGGTTAGGNVLNQYGKIGYPGSTSLQPVHDEDGNMTSGPVPGFNSLSPGVPIPANATLTWDAENRLVKVVQTSATVEYDYDHQSRLISRTLGSTTTRYLYDGWNRIAEYESTGTGHTVKRTYLWGMDLSGSMQGAGGVGGLLAMRVYGTTPATFYPTYDGNGNVSEYVDQGGDEAAHFEYDPFGNLTADSQSNAAQFPYRFSTKPQDLTTGHYYYGYRYYDPVTGRWPSRDPIGEEAFRSQLERSEHSITQDDDWGVDPGGLYPFVDNDGVNSIDMYGLLACCSGSGECRIEKTRITAPGVRVHVSTSTLRFAAVDPVSGCSDCLDYIERFNEGACKAQAKVMELAENALAALGGAPGMVVVYFGTYTRSIPSDRCVGAP